MSEMKITGPTLADHDELMKMAERGIRDLAAGVKAQIETRQAHPSYGYTKAGIKSEFDRLNGAIGLYMVLTLQATHTGVFTQVKFREEQTRVIVEEARHLMGMYIR